MQTIELLFNTTETGDWTKGDVTQEYRSILVSVVEMIDRGATVQMDVRGKLTGPMGERYGRVFGGEG